MAGDAPHLLVVDDDVRLRALLHRYLADNGFRVTEAGSAEDARARLKGLAFDLIILDIMMPGESGDTLTESLRRESNVPILLLSAMGEPENRIAGLEKGADDYLTKPFEPRELLLRVATILRRARAEPAAPRALSLGTLSFHPASGELHKGNRLVRLTSGETELLCLLARHAGRPVSRERLSQSAALADSTRAVDVQINRLRRKIEPDPRAPRYLLTVWGVGYTLRPD